MSDQYSGPGIARIFAQHFGEAGKLFRAPARTNIIGEHCDYNDGLVMPVNMALYTWLAIAPGSDRRVRIRADNLDRTETFDLDNIERNPEGGWAEYPKGVIHVLQENGFHLSGADMVIGTDIPIGGGLSSSASLETVVGLAMLTLAGHEIDRSELAWMCKEAENDFVGVSCGIMDQYVIALSDYGHAMKLDCRSMDYEQVPLPENTAFMVVNSGVKHTLSDGGYNSRQQECTRAVEILRNDFPNMTALRDINLEQLHSRRQALGETLFRRARHVVTEIQRVRDAHGAMVAGDSAYLGQLINASHDSLRDDYEVSCRELDDLVGIARDCEGVLGSRMVGAGFGGCTVSLVESAASDDVMAEIRERYGKLLGQEPWCCTVIAAEPVSELSVR